jgi:hypothetical protein
MVTRVMFFLVLVTPAVGSAVSARCHAADVPQLPSVLVADDVARVGNLTIESLIEATAGRITDRGFSNYPTFDDYWRANEVSRVGKVFEACVAHATNTRHAEVGDSRRLIPTAALGHTQNKADLLLVDGDRILARIQSKLGLAALEDAVQSPDYQRMQLLTCKETYRELCAKVARETEKAARRGVPLSPKWRAIEAAIQSGRIWPELPCGAALPSRYSVTEIAKTHYLAAWSTKAKAAPAPSTANAALNGQRLMPADRVGPQSGPSPKVPEGTTVSASRTSEELRSRVPHARVASGNPSATPVGGHLPSRAIDSVDDVAKQTADASRWGRVGAIAGRTLAMGAFVIETARSGYDVYRTETDFTSGQITLHQREVENAGHLGGYVGKWTGGSAGAGVGAILGAEVGTAVWPGAGTLVGTILGGAGGAIGGMILGEKAVRAGAESATQALHQAGTTITESAAATAASTRQVLVAGYRGLAAGSQLASDAGATAAVYLSESASQVYAKSVTVATHAKAAAVEGTKMAAMYADHTAARATECVSQLASAAYDGSLVVSEAATEASEVASTVTVEAAIAVGHAVNKAYEHATVAWRRIYVWAAE